MIARKSIEFLIAESTVPDRIAVLVQGVSFNDQSSGRGASRGGLTGRRRSREDGHKAG